MRELHGIASSLREVDGSCRDVNFEAPTWAGVDALMASLATVFESSAVTDVEGTSVAGYHSTALRALALSGGQAELYGGSGFVRTLQVFVSREEDAAPFVELTFFPEDILQPDDARCSFVAWASAVTRLLEARRWYARYENASWRFGDVGPQSGVFAYADASESDA